MKGLSKYKDNKITLAQIEKVIRRVVNKNNKQRFIHIIPFNESNAKLYHNSLQQIVNRNIDLIDLGKQTTQKLVEYLQDIHDKNQKQ